MRKADYKKVDMTIDNEIYTGQSIERYAEQASVSQQPIEGGAPEIFTDRKDGVIAEFNIRTDRFDIALNAMDKASASITAKRQEILNQRNEETTTTTEKPQ